MAAVVLAACSSKADKPKDEVREPPPPPPPRDAPPVAVDADPRMTAVPQPVAPGPYAVAYDCMHSNMPFGKGGWYRNQSADLANNEWALLEVTDPGDDDQPPKPNAPPPPVPEPTITPVSVPVSAKLGGAIDRVLAGGPYRAEYPVPEGTPCTLTIRTTGDNAATVFAIEKADTAEHDAVSDLIVLFRSVAGT